MKRVCEKLSNVLKTIFGYGIMVVLFAGGLTFFGYVVALFVGGETAGVICAVIYKKIIPIVIYVSVIMVLVGLASMYLSGEVALTPDKKKNSKN